MRRFHGLYRALDATSRTSRKEAALVETGGDPAGGRRLGRAPAAGQAGAARRQHAPPTGVGGGEESPAALAGGGELRRGGRPRGDDRAPGPRSWDPRRTRRPRGVHRSPRPRPGRARARGPEEARPRDLGRPRRGRAFPVPQADLRGLPGRCGGRARGARAGQGRRRGPGHDDASARRPLGPHGRGLGGPMSEDEGGDPLRPYPFFLAHAVPAEPAELGDAADFARVEVGRHPRPGGPAGSEAVLWSRGETS